MVDSKETEPPFESDALEGILSDAAELSLDSLLEPGLVQDIPVVGTLVAAVKVGARIRERHFAQKVHAFIRELQKIPEPQRRKFADELHKDPKFRKRTGETVIVLLDRFEAVKKAELMGRTFRAFCEGKIEREPFERINAALDRFFLYDLEYMPTFAMHGSHMPFPVEIQQSFISAGFAYSDSGFGGSSAEPTDTCKLFVEFVLEEGKPWSDPWHKSDGD